MVANDTSANEAPRRGLAWPAYGGLISAGLVWAFWVANFNDFQLGGSDPLRPFSFLQRIFGETHDAFGYQFGLAFVWAPFYAVGRLLHLAGVHTVEGEPIGIAMITIGTSLLVIVLCGLLVPLLRRLRLGHEGFVLLVCVFVTPLLYYGSFTTGLSHVADTLLITGLMVLLYYYLASNRPSLWLPVAMGVVGGYAPAVRFFNGFCVIALGLGLVFYRRFRGAAVVALVSAVTFLVLSSIPRILGVKSLTSGLAQSSSQAVGHTFAFRPQNPVLMLVSDSHGIFVWTPVMLIGVAGFLGLLRWRADIRPFLVITGAMGLALIVPYVGVRFWSGPSFSDRYLTPLFPLVVLGVAALVDRRPRLVMPAASVAALWTIALAFYGPPGIGLIGPASGLPRGLIGGSITPSVYVDAVYHRARVIRAVLPDPVNQGRSPHRP